MQYRVEEAHNGRMLRDLLRTLGVSSALLARLKREERGIMLNGTRVTVRARVQTGDLLELAIEDASPSPRVLANPLEFEILLETADFLAINKPANMPTHPSHGHLVDTLANALVYEFSTRGEVFCPRFINRLDRNTTGIVLVARHALGAAKLSKALVRGEFEKVYYALVKGRFDTSVVIETGICHKQEGTVLRTTCPVGEGEYAKTVATPILPGEAFSLVRLMPTTGRTHQLRVHMASLGHPLLGDDYYGDGEGMPRHALHAARLSFPNPAGEGTLTVQAPLPRDMWALIEQMGEEAIALVQKELEA